MPYKESLTVILYNKNFQAKDIFFVDRDLKFL